MKDNSTFFRSFWTANKLFTYLFHTRWFWRQNNCIVGFRLSLFHWRQKSGV